MDAFPILDNTADPIRGYHLRLQSSLCCLGIYLFLVILAISLLAVDLMYPIQSNYSSPTALFQIILDAVLTCFLAVEISIGWIAVHKGSCREYLTTWSARIDVVILILSILFYLLLYGHSSSSTIRSIEAMDSIVLGVRYSIQVLRLLVLIKRSKQSRDLAVQSDVDFRSLELSSGGGKIELELDSMAEVSLGFDEEDHHDVELSPAGK